VGTARGPQLGRTRLKQLRGPATRYEKRAANYWALVILAAMVIWLVTRQPDPRR
jgi:transposase